MQLIAANDVRELIKPAVDKLAKRQKYIDGMSCTNGGNGNVNGTMALFGGLLLADSLITLIWSTDKHPAIQAFRGARGVIGITMLLRSSKPTQKKGQSTT